MTKAKNSPKIAFVLDERLSHNRKAQFTKFLSVLKPKYNFELISARQGETEFLKHLKTEDYSLIMLPWYHYLNWSQVENHYGSLRLEGPTVAGYFADAILPFELTGLPNYHRMILLDFYRFDAFEIEMMLNTLIYPDQKTGFTGILPKSSTIYHQDWFQQDRMSTRALDAVMHSTLLQSRRWKSRADQIRFYLTALWTLCFHDPKPNPSLEACGELELAEFSKRLAIKFVFSSSELTLKQMMSFMWPTEKQSHLGVQTLIQNSDFLRVHHFPEKQKIEITAFFTPEAPVLQHPGEVRGFWIEPQKMKYFKSRISENFDKRIPIQSARELAVSDQFSEILEQLKVIHLHLGSIHPDERFILEHQIANLRFLMGAIEKKVAEKKKVA